MRGGPPLQYSVRHVFDQNRIVTGRRAGFARLVDGPARQVLRRCERYAKSITIVQERPMLRQLLVGTAVSVCNIVIHALVMATVVQLSSRIAGAKNTVQQSLQLTTVM